MRKFPVLVASIALAVTGIAACSASPNSVGRQGVVSGAETNPTVSGEFGKTPKVSAGKGEAPKKLEVKVLHAGKGPEVKEGATVLVNYHGTLWKDGSVFDSSFERGQPINFGLNQVIAGWKEGIPGHRLGDRLLLVVPAEKGYGAAGSGQKIPPNSPLVFIVDILDSVSAKDAPAVLKNQKEVTPKVQLPVEIKSQPAGKPIVLPVKGASFTGAKPEFKVVANGTGPKVGAGQTMCMFGVAVPLDGKGTADSNWDKEPQCVPVAQGQPGFGLNVGSRMVMLIPHDPKRNTPKEGVAVVYDIVGTLSPKGYEEKADK